MATLARRLVLKAQRWDWLARYESTVTAWDGRFDLQLVCQCVSTAIPEVHW